VARERRRRRRRRRGELVGQGDKIILFSVPK
jgi:hypothetical protein